MDLVTKSMSGGRKAFSYRSSANQMYHHIPLIISPRQESLGMCRLFLLVYDTDCSTIHGEINVQEIFCDNSLKSLGKMLSRHSIVSVTSSYLLELRIGFRFSEV